MKPTSMILRRATGFTLVEMAIVLLIVTLLLTGLVPTISSQIEQRQRNETRKQLDEIRDALLGFVVSKGRLPCPASATTNGMESPTTGSGICTNLDGLLPAATLGISPTDSQGYAVDGWSNRIRYAVTIDHANAFTKINGMQAIGMGTLNPDLSVCVSATGIIPPTSCGAATNILTNNAVAVIYSIGRNTVAAGIDEAANLDGDQVFVSHVPSPAGAINGEFDDIVTWLSPNILFNRMVAAGKLP